MLRPFSYCLLLRACGLHAAAAMPWAQASVMQKLYFADALGQEEWQEHRRLR